MRSHGIYALIKWDDSGDNDDYDYDYGQMKKSEPLLLVVQLWKGEIFIGNKFFVFKQCKCLLRHTNNHSHWLAVNQHFKELKRIQLPFR